MIPKNSGFTFRNTVLLLLSAIVLWFVLQYLSTIAGWIGGFFSSLTPFFLGCVLAFLLNLPMRFFERKLLPGRGGRLRRPVCFLLSLVLVLLITFGVLHYVVPRVIDTAMQLATNLPRYIENLETTLEPFLEEHAPVIREWIGENEEFFDTLQANIGSFFAHIGNTLLSAAVSIATSAVGQIISFVLSFVCACYLLFGKERFRAQAAGFFQAYLPAKRYPQVRSVAILTYQTYANFISRQCLEALIEGAMFFVVLVIGRFEHALLISVIMAFMALLPIVGAWIGTAFGAFMLLLSMGPMRMLAFILISIVLQQIEGNLIFPHVVGKGIGLPPLWTLVAVMIGSNYGGIFGILFFIPLCSVAYTLLRQHTLSALGAKKTAGFARSPAEDPDSGGGESP